MTQQQHQHWYNNYVGMPFNSSFNCLDLVILIQQEVFNRTLDIPNKNKPYSQMIEEHYPRFVINTDSNIDGDLVLMTTRSATLHLGIYFQLHNVDYVIHNDLNGTIITNLDKLLLNNLSLKGIYKWK